MANHVKPFKDDVIKHASELKIKIIGIGRTSSKDKCSFICVCGKPFERTARAFLVADAGCPECVKKEMHRKQSVAKLGSVPVNKESIEVYIEKLENLGRNRRPVGPIVKGIGLHKCLDCGDVRAAYKHNVMRFDCRECQGLNKKTLDQYNAELATKGIPFTAHEYTGSREKVVHTCNRCNEFEVSAMPTNMITPGKVLCNNCDERSITQDIYVGRYKFRVRGFERFVVKALCKRFGPSNVKCDLGGGVPKISVGRKRFHMPDFYIPSENILFEVKSPYTAGLTDLKAYGNKDVDLFTLLKRKANSAIEAGFDYRLILVDTSGNQIPVPKDWSSMTRKQLIKCLGQDHLR